MINSSANLKDLADDYFVSVEFLSVVFLSIIVIFF